MRVKNILKFSERVETQKTKKKKTNITEPIAKTSILTQEERNNIELIKKIPTEKEVYIIIPKESGLEKRKIETEKVNRLLK